MLNHQKELIEMWIKLRIYEISIGIIIMIIFGVLNTGFQKLYFNIKLSVFIVIFYYLFLFGIAFSFFFYFNNKNFP